MAKSYDQIITLIESYIESPKPESWRLKPKDRGSDTKTVGVKLEIHLAVNEHWLWEIMFVFVEFKFAFF